MEPWTLTTEARRLKKEQRRVHRLVVADSHHNEEEQNPGPHYSDADPQPCVKTGDITVNLSGSAFHKKIFLV
jgi:hypothetical protein